MAKQKPYTGEFRNIPWTMSRRKPSQTTTDLIQGKSTKLLAFKTTLYIAHKPTRPADKSEKSTLTHILFCLFFPCLVMAASSLVPVGEACDFDEQSDHKLMKPTDACQQWTRPPASDGRSGFVITNGIHIRYNREQAQKAASKSSPGTKAGSEGSDELSDRPVSGPKTDRSEGTDMGNFAMFSAAAHGELTRADIQSPWFGSTGPRCTLQFAMHMSGTNIGTLQILLTTSTGLLRSMGSMVGDKGAKWVRRRIALGQIDEPFRIIFQAVQGKSDSGHIAIDSISLDHCHPDLSGRKTCPLNEFMCETKVCIPRNKMCDFQYDCLGGEDENQTYCDTIPEKARCNFENGYCEFQNASQYTYNWVRHSGPPPSKDGPKTDHTHGLTAHGHYIFTKALEQSNRGKQYRQHIIYSSIFPPPPKETWIPGSPFFGTCSLRLFYHMTLSSISLKVYIEEFEEVYGSKCERGESPRTDSAPLIYLVSSAQVEDVWRLQTEPLPKITKYFRLKFQALVGMLRYEHAETALDDVSLSPECFGMGVVNITNNATEYIEATCNKTLDREEKQCFNINHILQAIPKSTVNSDGECGWTLNDLLRVNLTRASSSVSDYEAITEVINSSARFTFKTCGCTGRGGPTQYQCDAAYASTHLVNGKVRVLTKPPSMYGFQVWIVPETGFYSITAIGASGGTGIQNTGPSTGAYANAKFNLTKGEEIYMLIGQMGQSACSDINRGNEKTKNICRKGIFPENSKPMGGGGGGGGGTFVFKMDPMSHELIPLIIAGGGGGKSYRLGNKPVNPDGGISPSGSGLPGYSPENGPGAGGGWKGDTRNLTQGRSLHKGGLGGAPCGEAYSLYHWQLYGGFGGGGGGCTAGGGGGGYSGGNVSLTDDAEHNGQGGSSFISHLGNKPIKEPGVRSSDGNGEVEIAVIIPCACSFLCIYHNLEEKKFKCYCPPNHVLADDGTTCIDPKTLTGDTPLTRVIATIVGPIIVVIIFAIACIFCYNVVRSKRTPPPGLGLLTRADYQLDQLRSQVGGPSIMSEYNPNYDFGGTNCTLQDLQEIPRSQLTLVRGLGQGAFGEVYQGYLTNENRDPRKLPVAVKTLPALSTDQAEMDFLMEALIMSKFQHPNIVRFIGVCFEKHPRFIILELLEGGDLKTFLRDSRPKPDQPSRVTMMDLVKLALDVAKGCQYLEENHFIHRDIAARNCLLTSKIPDRVAKIADFGMARDIYRADYYRKGGKAMLPVKWMPPEAFLDGIFTSKTDVWSFGILLWEVFSLGYMPYPGRGNQEVMQLVTAGGRLEPPDNCPLPVYHTMNLCWHGIPERRPTFTVIIDRLQRCLQDPEVIHSPLPIFRRPPSIERDATIMRPRDTDQMVLSVEPPVKYLEPGSPNSMDQLIGPQSPDIADLMRKRPNMRASAESIDELLRQDEEDQNIGTAAGAAAPGANSNITGPSTPKNFSYQRVWDYDGIEDSLGDDTAAEGIEELASVESTDAGASSAGGGAEGEADAVLNDIVGARGVEGYHSATAQQQDGGATGSASADPEPPLCHHHCKLPSRDNQAQQSRGSCAGSLGGPTQSQAIEGEDSTGDSGKSSLENMASSQSNLDSEITTAAFIPQSSDAAPTTNQGSFNSQQQQQQMAKLPVLKTNSTNNNSNSSLTSSSTHSNSPKADKIVPVSVAAVVGSGVDPWERQQTPASSASQPQSSRSAALPATASNNPCYVNVDLATGKCYRPVMAESSSHNRLMTPYQDEEDEGAGQDPGDSGVVIDFSNTSAALDKLQHNQQRNNTNSGAVLVSNSVGVSNHKRPMTSYTTGLTSSTEGQGERQDQGDSGVVIDLKGCNSSVLNTGQSTNGTGGGQTWL